MSVMENGIDSPFVSLAHEMFGLFLESLVSDPLMHLSPEPPEDFPESLPLPPP